MAKNKNLENKVEDKVDGLDKVDNLDKAEEVGKDATTDLEEQVEELDKVDNLDEEEEVGKDATTDLEEQVEEIDTDANKVIKEFADKIFASDKSIEELYFTSDFQAFSTKNLAQNNAKELEDKNIITITRK